MTERIEKQLQLSNGLWVAKAHVDDLIEQDVNARVMSKEMFDQLTKNVKKRGMLESLPYCASTPKGTEIVSGHHRVRVARAAGISTIYILLDTNKLTQDEITARQLAHNSIQGVEDKEMLKRLYESINDVDLRLETFITPDDLGLELDMHNDILDIAPDIEFKAVTFMFLPYQVDDFNEMLERLSGDETQIGALPIETFNKFKEAVIKVQKTENIKSIGSAIARMTDIVLMVLKSKEERV